MHRHVVDERIPLVGGIDAFGDDLNAEVAAVQVLNELSRVTLDPADDRMIVRRQHEHSWRRHRGSTRRATCQ